jgi:hypothetical protein
VTISRINRGTKEWRKERKKDVNDRRDMQEEENKRGRESSQLWDTQEGWQDLKTNQDPSLRETWNANRITVLFPGPGVPVDKNSTRSGNTFTYTGITFHIRSRYTGLVITLQLIDKGSLP